MIEQTTEMPRRCANTPGPAQEGVLPMQRQATKPRRTSVKRYPGIFLSSSGSYEYAFRDSDGKLRFKTVGKNLQAAVAAREEMRGRLRRGERVAPTRQTFSEFAAAWLDAQQQLR